jgi:hypothetical protein
VARTKKIKKTDEIIIDGMDLDGDGKISSWELSFVNMNVSLQIDERRKVEVGARIPMSKNETIQQAHKKLYKTLLLSLKELL